MCNARPEPQKPILMLLSGITGSGKATFASQVARMGAVRISVDELVYETHGAYGIDYPEAEYFSYECEAIRNAKHHMTSALRSGHDVIYDHGLWSTPERLAMSSFATGNDAVPVHINLPVSRAAIKHRLRLRNSQSGANALFVSDDALNDFYARYEPINPATFVAIDGTSPLPRVIENIRRAGGRSQHLPEPIDDFILDHLLGIMRSLHLPTTRVDVCVTDISGPAEARRFAAAVKAAFGPRISELEITAATPLALAGQLRTAVTAILP
ncbi:AAA family ATPase [Devriesea agamarum]|uniref:AAA family ATPase n=1 Tax=Devriesea agamarum TaxID=472569 RepID=UPI00071DE3D6|nr:ATP-binding protein [Devriesea agamarum]